MLHSACMCECICVHQLCLVLDNDNQTVRNETLLRNASTHEVSVCVLGSVCVGEVIVSSGWWIVDCGGCQAKR